MCDILNGRHLRTQMLRLNDNAFDKSASVPLNPAFFSKTSKASLYLLRRVDLGAKWKIVNLL